MSSVRCKKAGEEHMIFIVNGRQGPHGLILVITDKEILGKVFEEGKLQLDLSKEFYQGEEMSKEEVVALLEQAQHIHLTGKESVKLGIEQRFVEKKRILVVQGVPHAEVVSGE